VLDGSYFLTLMECLGPSCERTGVKKEVLTLEKVEVPGTSIGRRRHLRCSLLALVQVSNERQSIQGPKEV
jgi:hypothetical protein